MPATLLEAPVVGPDPVARALSTQGWGVFPGYLSVAQTERLAAECRGLWQDGCFRHAGVGRGESFELRPEIRNDKVLWLDPQEASPAQHLWLGELEALRQALNQALFLGLFEFEGHFAIYPPGSYYRKHLDQFRGIGLRTVTAILYLNTTWQAGDGGQLRLYLERDGEGEYLEVEPRGGTLVSFLSADYFHEVLPSRTERMSLTGWFRTRE